MHLPLTHSPFPVFPHTIYHTPYTIHYTTYTIYHIPYTIQYSVQSRVDERRNAVNRTKGANAPAAVSSVAAARGMTASGLSSASATQQSQDLDEDATNGLNRGRGKDALIDAGIDALALGLDKLGNLAGAITDETKDSAARIDKMDRGMQRTTEKQVIVNARQRYLLG
jgi:hypothetical protein